MPSPAGSRSALAAATESGLVAQDRVVSADGELMAAELSDVKSFIRIETFDRQHWV